MMSNGMGNRKILYLALSITLPLIALVALWLILGSFPTRAQGATTHYVAPGGDCGEASPCYTAIQVAVDAAAPGEEIRVATGTYTGVNNCGGLAQVVYISKTLTLRGGYAITNWTVSDPDVNPTTLDAQGQGRVLYITGDIAPTIEGLHITGGDATGLGGDHKGRDTGGGVYIVNATAIISNNQVFSNTAPYGGGGLHLYSSDATLNRNTVTSSTATFGGGLYLTYSDATLSGNIVTANTATYGGGLCLYSSDATLNRNTVTANTATTRAGGLYLWDSDATLNGNTVTANTATSNSGGLHLYGSDATLTNNVIADNQANTAGSGLYIRGSSPRLLHTTIARNTGGDGSGVYVTDQWGNYSTVALTNTILVSHTVGIYVSSANTATLESTLWNGNSTDWSGAGILIIGTRNYWGTPAFVDPDAGDYHIGPGSAAIDAGVDAGVTTDIDGDPRPQGAGYDVGADEYPAGVPTPTPTNTPTATPTNTPTSTSTPTFTATWTPTSVATDENTATPASIATATVTHTPTPTSTPTNTPTPTPIGHEVCGEVSGTWTAAESPYIVTCDITVTVGSLLTIEPGVEVRFATDDASNSGEYTDRTELTVRGTLNAIGTAAQPIRFTSAATDPQPGDWGQITLSGSDSTTNFEYVYIEYATIGLCVSSGDHANIAYSTIIHNSSDGIQVLRVEPKFDHCTISNNGRHGIAVIYYGSPQVTNSTICDNQGSGVAVGGWDSWPVVNNSTIVRNHEYAVKHGTYTDLDFRNNDWGTTDTAEIDAMILDINDALADALADETPGWMAPPAGLVDYNNGQVTNTLHITTNTTWNADQIIEIIDRHVWVDEDATLTIEPGIGLRFASGRLLLVQGRIQALA